MSGIAKLFFNRGITVSGSDVKESKIIQGLRGEGIAVFVGHRESNIQGADLVVYSTAINKDNPEMQAAKKANIPLIRRAEALAELMSDKIAITVTGSHGKTTTSSLVSCLLSEAGFMPTAAIGGIVKNVSTNVYLGDGKFFVAEADESDGSFLYYQPSYSIITNIDREHLDYYKDFESELNTFKEFLSRTKEDGCVFACGDDLNLRNLLKEYGAKFILFGLNADLEVHAENIEIQGLNSWFDCYCRNKLVERFSLGLGGRHNISNALAVIALGLELGIRPDIIKKALAGYQGAGRRIEIKFQDDQYLVIDDYAHHPTEIKATLAAVKNLRRKRIIAIFQPHRFTRTQLLLEEFGRSFAHADYIITTDIYPASEAPIEGVSGQGLYEKIKSIESDKQVEFLAKENIVPRILEVMRPDDLILTLGAGDIIKTCDDLVEALKRKS